MTSAEPTDAVPRGADVTDPQAAADLEAHAPDDAFDHEDKADIADDAQLIVDDPQPDAGPATRAESGRSSGRRMAPWMLRVRAIVKEIAIISVVALGLSFLIKTFLVQAFWIPSGSMEDTLRINDRVLVNKLVPSPMSLHRGDVVVFADPGEWFSPPPPEDHGPIANGLRDVLVFVGLLPSTSEDHLIKRVIGLPGDHVVCCTADGALTVNGTALDEPYLRPGVNPSDIEFDITVAPGRVWVMGDNRSNSEDSRFHGDGSTGSVPISDVTGRAVVVAWPFDHWAWLSRYPETFDPVPSGGG